MKPKRILHITPGLSAAGSLREALKLEREELIAFNDFFDGGPIVDFGSLEEWADIRMPYLAHFGYSAKDMPPLCLAGGENGDCIGLLRKADEVLLWIGTSVREQLICLG